MSGPFADLPLLLAACVPQRRDDALLAQATRALESGDYASALVSAEAACRRHPREAIPALLRANILEAAGSPLAGEAWYSAWSRAPAEALLQDALLRAWLARGERLNIAGLAPLLLPDRCREGTHPSLLQLFSLADVPVVGACWKGQDHIEVMLFAAPGESRLVLADACSGNQYDISLAPGIRAFRLMPPLPRGVWTLSVAAQGGRQALPGSPLSFDAPIPGEAARRQVRPVDAGSGCAPRAPLAVLVPVYRDFKATQSCLNSLLASVSANRVAVTILVVDDHGPEPALSAWLDGLASAGKIMLVRNPVNLGFIEAVNRGLRHLPGHDVVLLNADTLVNGDWLDRMQAALYSADDIASVTPWSNNGEITSFPAIAQKAPAPGVKRLRQLDKAAATLHRDGQTRDVELPACCGFAMLMRRTAIDRIGALDGAALGRGYGEEVDWCMRARAAGYRHLAATGVYVVHRGGLSFRLEKPFWVHRNRAVLAARYPDYYPMYQRFLKEDPLAAARSALLEASAADAGSPRPKPGKAARRIALQSHCLRIAVRLDRADAAAASKTLALARVLAARGHSRPRVRMIVLGDATEALWHTGVADQLPLAGENDAALLSDMDLLGIAGCRVLLNPGMMAAPAGIELVPIDAQFDPGPWLKGWLMKVDSV